MSNEKQISTVSLDIVYLLGIIFLLFQGLEYQDSAFTISDSVYGSCFFMATGFHGFHVIIGSIFLIVCFIRLLGSHLSQTHHLGFEAAAWYWHFVDVVWLFLFIVIYVYSYYVAPEIINPSSAPVGEITVYHVFSYL